MEAVDIVVVIVVAAASARFGIVILQAQVGPCNESVNQLHGRRLQNRNDIRWRR
jgi:hypothetical protein